MTVFAKPTKVQVDSFIKHPSHAVALSGVSGAGKNQVAKYIATKIFEISEEKIATHPYIKTIQATGKDAIATVREAQEFLQLTVPGKATLRRCIIVSDADNLGHEAQNALLKTLEEPPEDTVIVLTVSDENRLLDTVKSRLSWLQVYPLSPEESLASLQDAYPKDEIIKAWHISDGSIGLLINILQDNEAHPLVAAIEQAKSTLKQSAYERLISVDLLLKNKEFNLGVFLDATHRLLRAALSSAAAKGDKRQAQVLTVQIKNTLQAKEYVQKNVQPKLVLTELFYAL